MLGPSPRPVRYKVEGTSLRNHGPKSNKRKQIKSNGGGAVMTALPSSFIICVVKSSWFFRLRVTQT